MDGMMPVDELKARLPLPDLPAEGSYHTLAGLLLALLRRVPRVRRPHRVRRLAVRGAGDGRPARGAGAGEPGAGGGGLSLSGRAAVHDGGGVFGLGIGVPGEQDPGVLRHLGDEARPPRRAPAGLA